MPETFNERAGVEVSAKFEDALGKPALPATVEWRLDCETTRTALQDWIAVTPVVVNTASGVDRVYVDIDISGELNAIQRDKNKRELKTLLVAADRDTDREYNEEFSYYVRNLRGRE